MNAQCAQCGRAFVGKRKARFCSRACLYASLRQDVTVQCVQCGKDFTRKPWEIKEGRAKVCSRACQYELARGRPFADDFVAETRECAACGTAFVVGGRANGRLGQRFCSNACKYAARSRRGALPATLSPTDAAYIAGILDGEGSIMLITRGRTRPGAALRVAVSNTDESLLDWLAEVTEIGRVYRLRAPTERHQQSGAWRCHGDGAHALLVQVQPYLRVKAAQADLGIAAHERLKLPALKADRTWQEEWAARMKDLNRRGPRTPEPLDTPTLAGAGE